MRTTDASHIKKSSPTGLVFFPAFDWSISPTHPEREERLLYTRDQIFEEGLMDLPQIREYKPRLADIKDIARTHICVPAVSDQITEAHRIAAGGALVLADALMAGKIKNGFALVRPPGHHAMKVVHGNRGFCNINNEGVLVDYLRYRYGLRKIAIVDTDVHHGDGTQDIFYHDPNVLFISFHQDGRTLYPGTGFIQEGGGPRAYGKNLNIPLPPGTTDEELHYVLEQFILPVLKDFNPDLVINSAGQDNHYTDPLANMRISAQGYARLNEKLKPDLAVLEGGYAIETALPYVNTGIILAMAGLDYSHAVEPDYDPAMFGTSAERKAYLNKLIGELNTLWEGKNAPQNYTREKKIFYDTDSIYEYQRESLKPCPDCRGYLSIASEALHENGRRVKILALSLPFEGCQACVTEAQALYEKNIKTGIFDYVYLQDRVSDLYKGYSAADNREWRY